MNNYNIKRNIRKINFKRFSIFIVITIILTTSLFMLTKNLYISAKCKNPLFAIDYYLTTYKDKDIRLITIESFSILEESTGKLTIDAYGLNYAKPYRKINVLCSFERNDNGVWEMIEASLEPKN